MAENLILMFFLVLPSMLFVGARKFFVTTRPTMKDQKTAAAMIGALWIVGLVAATGLFAGEVYYRFIYDQTDTLGLCKTSFRWFDRHFHTNPGNFRDTFTYQPAATPGVRRVSFIGDSYTAAQGIDELNDRFATQFAKQRPDQEVHVLAACGWDTSSQLEMAYHMATADQKYDADVVVLVYNLDDIADLVPDWEKSTNEAFASTGDGWLAQNSYLINTLILRAKVAEQPRILESENVIANAYSGSVWQRQKGRLKSLHESITENGGKFHVVTFPFLSAMGPDYKYRDVHEKLGELWAELGVPHLDLLTTFEGQTAEDLIIAPYETNPNKQAHSMVAAALDEFLGPESE